MNYFTEADRKMLRLRVTHGLSWERIAEEMDVQRETIFYRLKRLRERTGLPTNEVVVDAFAAQYFPRLLIKRAANKTPSP